MFDTLQEIWNNYLFTPETGTFSLILAVLSIVAMWMIFQKAGRGGWRSLIPLYNLYTLVDIGDPSGWKFLLFLIPLVGQIYYLVFAFRLARSFHRGTLFGLGLILFPPLFMLILGFGSSTYKRRRR
jgi:hypothetical protein